MRSTPLLLTFSAMLLGVWTVSPAGEPLPHRAGSLAKDGPQAGHAPDPADAWNRIFYCCYPRTVRARLAGDFPEGEPFDRVDVMSGPLPVSKRWFERIESGDRSLEPFYPSYFARYGKAPYERWVK